ncbi:MAG: type II toxin-antitoxin system RelE/ParE family toxin [bacterium]
MYQVEIDTLVLEEDFKYISKENQRRILKEINYKLTTAPDKFGKPLRKSLKGLYKLPVGQYRIVYQIFKHKVLVEVIAVGFRRDLEVYKTALKRLKRFLG